MRVVTVFKVRVITKDLIKDTFARFKSIFGGRVKSYELAIQEGLEDAYAEMLRDFPRVKNIRFGTTEMLKDGAEIILYGEVPYSDYMKYMKNKEKYGPKKL